MNYLIYIIIGLGALILSSKDISDILLGDDKRDSFDYLFELNAARFGVPAYVLKTIASIESDIGQDSRVLRGDTSGDSKSWGIMQIAPGLGSNKEIQLKSINRKNATPGQLNNPEISIMIGARLLGYLWKKYNGNEDLVSLAYNQGEKNTDNGRDFTPRFNSEGKSYKEKFKEHKKRILT